MPYAAEISRRNPSCFVFVIDQSGSMADPFGGDTTRKKSDGVSDAINRLLQNLVIKCARDQGVQDYFHVGVIGYGSTVGPAFGGSLAGRELVPISEVGNLPARVEVDGRGPEGLIARRGGFDAKLGGDAPRPGRQDDHAAAEVHGLEDAVGDEEHGQPLPVRKRREVVLELEARDLVESREGLVHQ